VSRVPHDGYVGTHYLGEEELAEVAEVLRSKSLFRYEGPQLLHKTVQFEQKLAQFLHAENTVAVNNGHSALKMAWRGLGLGPGDEVLVPAFTFISTASSVLEVGAQPNFVDIDETMNMSPAALEAAITDRTRAIAPVHMRGVPCDMDPILDIARRHGLYVVEDCAQSFGATYRGRSVGTLGDAAAYSFHSHKIITTGEGGAFTARDPEVFTRAQRFHDYGGVRINGEIPTWTGPEAMWGENYKITEMQSAIGLAQLRKAEGIIQHQRDLFKAVVSGLKPELKLSTVPSGAAPVPFTICLQFPTAEDCNAYMARAAEFDIRFGKMTSWFLPGFNAFKNKVSWHPAWNPFQNPPYDVNPCAESRALLDRSAWLPLSPLLTGEGVELIQHALNSCI
jgi:8-amino-3,8-dideoxy-alpha-D-manno-octulosonate transaminase